MKTKLLLVEDEERLGVVLRTFFEKKNFSVDIVKDGEDAIFQAENTKPDVILLDWMLPNMSGIEICRQIRTSKSIKKTPIIFLTAKGEQEDKLKGLDVGADDYVTKPFSQLELLARVNALLRRSNPSNLDDELSYKKTLIMNLKTHRVKREGTYVKLNPKEFDLLKLFLQNPGKVFSRDQLLDKVWGNINVEHRTVDVHIRRLRKNININGTKDLIRTVRSSGYSLDIIK
ncbi:MAG: Phosphate regulon transcriptional regulatory protein PhoB [Alphaproteobacteria bacterium MarineAlpha6_Bin6]|nr:DNA-binding response regulator [Pelagibacteraceae bacterium]PPR29224.1 MAG: Phosphate regulon transcriptional regulatory protein PhoB [Alphaproteobacteria bacterium MarineAlpha6_Bin6]PPR33010.1 MAG: Phosphate regulon transcriptional regulatory protein PhoB [Alphaproteobacteria bacterium MarineAlpha6_Bin5]|tara:strand:+ start:1277 stop:1966 length:690 start_codon:yes stop_codon:yes gene_type:complete